MLCATALAQQGRVTVLTSDVEDITLLTTEHPRVTAEKVWLPPRGIRDRTAIGSSPLPLLCQESVGAGPVGVVVGDGGDDQFVGAGGLLQLFELVRDPSG